MFWTYTWRHNKLIVAKLFALPYPALLRRIAPSSVVCPSVFLSLCQCVTLVNPAKKRLKRSSYHLRSGLGWAQWTTYYMKSTRQHGKGQFWVGNRQTIVKYGDTLQSSVQTWLNQTIWHFSCGLKWAKDAQVQSYSPGGANVPTWEDTLPSPVE